jgi:Tfp pilus assembly protein PilF
VRRAAEGGRLAAHATACLEAGRLDEAEQALREIIAGNPREHFALALLARLQLERGAAEAALDAARAALALDRGNPDYHNLVGVCLAELARYDEALAALRRAHRLRPASAEIHYNLGKLARKMRDPAGAREAFRRAVAIDPRYPGARFGLAEALQELGEPEEAFAAGAAALADDPDDPLTVCQFGRLLAATRGHEAALEHLCSAAARLPQSALVRHAYADSLLAAGRFSAGWREYLARVNFGPAPRHRLPEQLPADLQGATVVLRAEQGLGDVLFFLRFLPLLRERGGRPVVVAAPPRLAALLARAGVPLAAAGDAQPAAHADSRQRVVELGDLPYALDTEATPPPLALTARPERVRPWRERLAAWGPPPYVGVTWRAGTDRRTEPEFGRRWQSLFKEVDSGVLGRALARAPGTLVSVQRGPAAGEAQAFAAASGRRVFDASSMNDDLEEALALLEVLDEYVCVSNTNVHLRAGLGRTSRVLVPFPAEWRWLAEGRASPWFPGCAVYRQSARRSWERALAELAADVGERVG